MIISDHNSFFFSFKKGLDSRSRPIVIFVAEKMNVKNMDMDKFFLYILSFMDPIVANEYVLVYIHTGLDASHRPTFNWLKNAYSVFNRKYVSKQLKQTNFFKCRFKKNVKQVYIVQPSRWLKIVASCFRLVISTKFWKKVVYVESLSELQTQHKLLI